MPDSSKKDSNRQKKKLVVRRKTLNISTKQAIYKCNSFELFCNFCEAINKNTSFNPRKFSKDISLYLYNNTYYLIVKNINTSYPYEKFFYSIASEFLTPLTFSNNFESKLNEHGQIIMRKQAITTGIKYFC